MNKLYIYVLLGQNMSAAHMLYILNHQNKGDPLGNLCIYVGLYHIPYLPDKIDIVANYSQNILECSTIYMFAHSRTDQLGIHRTGSISSICDHPHMIHILIN